MPRRISLRSGSTAPDGSRLRAFRPWTLKGRRKAHAPKTKHPAAATKPHQVLPMAIAGVLPRQDLLMVMSQKAVYAAPSDEATHNDDCQTGETVLQFQPLVDVAVGWRQF